MRLYEIDNRNEVIIPLEDADRNPDSSESTAGWLIRRDCEKWLKESRGKPVYRGVRNAPGFFTSITTRKDRTPKDIDRDLHDILVRIFNDLGFHANRNNSVFVKGESSGLHDYGDMICNVFPIGDYSYTWSNTIPDLFEHFDMTRNIDWMEKGIFVPENEEEFSQGWGGSYNFTFNELFNNRESLDCELDYQQFKWYIDANYIDSKELVEAIDSDHEIAITCDKYYLILVV